MQHHITTSAEEPSAPNRLLLPLLATGHASTHWYAGVLGALLPWIREDLGLTYAQIGLLMTGRALLGACGNVATSIAADLGGRRRNILIGSVFMVALCYILIGLSTSLLMLLVFSSMAAMASNAWHPPAMSLLGERFPNRRGYALGWHGTGANLGQTISPLAVGAMLSFMSWRATLYVNIWPGLLMGLLLLWLLPMLDDDRLSRQAKGYWRDLKSGLVYNSAVMKVAVLSILRTMGQQGLETFLPLYMADSLKFSPALVGVGLAVMTFSGSWLEPLSGLLSDRIGRKPILFASLFLSALSVWGLTLVSGVWLPLLFIGLIGLLHLSLRPIIMAFAMDVTPSGIGASTIGFVFSVNQLFSAFTPLMTGYIADVYDLKTAFYVFAVLTLIAALWVPLTSRARTEDAVA
jgi:MFS family permease